MDNRVFTVKSVSDIGKYAKFTLDDGSEHYGKYGYFSHIAYNLIGGVNFPVKVRIDKLGVNYFHVEAIWNNGVWVKVKERK